MYHEIGCINQVLPSTVTGEKTEAIQNWLESVLDRIEHYKSAHYELLKDYMTQLELALWKSKLHEREGDGEGEEFSLSSDLSLLWKKKMTLLEFSRLKANVDEEFRVLDTRHVSNVAQTLLSRMCSLSLMMKMCSLH